MSQTPILGKWDMSGMIVDASAALVASWATKSYLEGYLTSLGMGKEAFAVGLASWITYDIVTPIIKSLDKSETFYGGIHFNMDLLKDGVLYGGGSAAIYTVLKMIFGGDGSAFKQYAILLTSILGSKLAYPKLQSLLGWSKIIEPKA